MVDKRKRFEADIFVKKGLDLFKRQSLDQAKRCFLNALELDPTNEVAKENLEKLGVPIPLPTKKKSKETRTTKKIVKKPRTKDIPLPPTLELGSELAELIHEGIISLGAQDFEKAQNVFTRITEDFPESSLGWLYLGDALVIQGLVDEGRGPHQKAVSLDPSLSDPVPVKVHPNMPEVPEVEVRRIDKDGKEVTVSVDLTDGTHRLMTPPDSIKALFQGQQIVHPLMEKTIEKTKRDLKTNPFDSELWWSLGYNLILAGRPIDANEALAHSLALDPANRSTRKWFLICQGFIDSEK